MGMSAHLHIWQIHPSLWQGWAAFLTALSRTTRERVSVFLPFIFSVILVLSHFHRNFRTNLSGSTEFLLELGLEVTASVDQF